MRIFTFVNGAWLKVRSDIYCSQDFSYFSKSVSLAQDSVGPEGTNFKTGSIKVF